MHAAVSLARRTGSWGRNWTFTTYPRQAFDTKLSADAAIGLFRHIYDHLFVLLVRAAGVSAAMRPVPFGLLNRHFQNLKAGLSGFSWGGAVDLLNFRNGNSQSSLLPSLASMSAGAPAFHSRLCSLGGLPDLRSARSRETRFHP